MPTQMGTRIAVEVDRVAAGWAHSVEGGYASAPVVSEKAGLDHTVRKHIGAAQYEDLTIRGGAGIFNALQDWIKESLALKNPRKDGVICTCDLDGNIVSTLEWQRERLARSGSRLPTRRPRMPPG